MGCIEFLVDMVKEGTSRMRIHNTLFNNSILCLHISLSQINAYFFISNFTTDSKTLMP